ncbi:MAG: glutathione S-transferase N-terminal domain-containing protein [Pseudomonadales bacterium]|nr:glutathione S-transferase N-terminal domain-containing protein [Pseudomonadales bacterium]
MSLATKRSSMTLFSDPRDHYSHRVRMVLCEKGVSVDIVDVDPDDRPDELSQINPYNTLPTLLDRDLVLYQSNVIMEYLDERFPHPPLLPVYPVARAQSKLLMHRIEKDWSSAVDLLMSGSGKDKTRNELRESLAGIAPIFDDRKFFMNEEFSLVDCCVAPILWRLPAIDISLPEKQTKSMQRYMNDMFSRETFIDSLTESELEMRE